MRKRPYHGFNALEAVEAAMVAAAFDHEVTLLFKDDGVWQLTGAQHGNRIERRTMSKVIAGLETYDIDRLFVCGDSLTARGIGADALPSAVTIVDGPAQTALLNAADVVLND